MRKKFLMKIFAGMIAVLLILTIFFIANLFLGNPVSASIAKGKALSYIRDKYSHLDLKISDVTYNAKDGVYYISVSSNTSIDTNFTLRYRNGEIYADDYETSVLSGMNTVNRLCDEYEKSLTPLVQEKTKNVTEITVMPEKYSNYNLELDSTFEPTLVKNVEIKIHGTGGTDPKYISDILKVTYTIMNENGYAAQGFGIRCNQGKEIIELINIKPSHMEKENLDEILQKAMTNNEYDGIIAFSKG